MHSKTMWPNGDNGPLEPEIEHFIPLEWAIRTTSDVDVVRDLLEDLPLHPEDAHGESMAADIRERVTQDRLVD